jgi:hypothetical protein
VLVFFLFFILRKSYTPFFFVVERTTQKERNIGRMKQLYKNPLVKRRLHVYNVYTCVCLYGVWESVRACTRVCMYLHLRNQCVSVCISVPACNIYIYDKMQWLIITLFTCLFTYCALDNGLTLICFIAYVHLNVTLCTKKRLAPGIRATHLQSLDSLLLSMLSTPYLQVDSSFSGLIQW